MMEKQDNYCNNCGKPGHMYHQCKMPIISIGTIVFKKTDNNIEFLMIRRKHSLGFMDFMRGKYSIYNKDYILNLMREMTVEEKQMILENDFMTLWNYLWNKKHISNQYKQEQQVSEEKYNSLKYGVFLGNETYSLDTMMKELTGIVWEEPEWGFPKGRRNHCERDFDCALREFSEETGYNKKSLVNIENILPFEEIFTGSNYKSYKHKYYILMMSESTCKYPEHYDKNEVGKMEWKTYEECLECIRPYNLEKKRLLENVYKTLCCLK